MKALKDTEQLIQSIWPRKLCRLPYGCDFLEKDTGNLVEIKTRTLSDFQVKDMVYKYISGILPYLVIIGGVDNNHILTFRLEQIQTRDDTELTNPMFTPPEARLQKRTAKDEERLSTKRKNYKARRKEKPEKKYMEKTSVQMEQVMIDDLEKIAKDRGMTRSQLVRKFLSENINAEKIP